MFTVFFGGFIAHLWLKLYRVGHHFRTVSAPHCMASAPLGTASAPLGKASAPLGTTSARFGTASARYQHGECASVWCLQSLLMEDQGHVQIMHPHLCRRRRQYKPRPRAAHAPISQYEAEGLGPFGHGLSGTNIAPVVITRPHAYRRPTPSPSVSTTPDDVLRQNDAKLLERLAHSKAKQEEKAGLRTVEHKSVAQESKSSKRFFIPSRSPSSLTSMEGLGWPEIASFH